MTDDIPPEIVKDLQEKTRQMKHPWMYSFMPGLEGSIYLVGYCKVCDNTVSSRVAYDRRRTIMSKADIPKWGCIPDQELD